MSDNKSIKTPLADNKKLVRIIRDANRLVNKLHAVLSLENVADAFKTTKSNVSYHMTELDRKEKEAEEGESK